MSRTGELNQSEWAVAMHLILCLTTKGLPTPDCLPV
ncbi:unnamed protein product, partial [Discosporangium mesarthrocarpum]